MSDLEFDVLDELYFLQSFDYLLKATELEHQELKLVLAKLWSKGWIKCFGSVNEELPPEEVEFDVAYRGYLYLASKAGLLAHNGS